MKKERFEFLKHTTIEKVEKEYRSNPWKPSPTLMKLEKLSPSERRLMIIYAETGSYRKMADAFGRSKTSIETQLNRIRKKLQ